MEFLEILRAVGSIAAVLGLLAGALYVVRKRGLLAAGGVPARNLAVVARIALTANHSLHLVQSDGGTFLIATHQHGCTLIDSRRTEEAAARQIGAAC